ncbi:MAG: hypothetical protein KAI50_12755 [Desulfobacterales bacterium]|nr:hypothetical protein [Desulfobacterales bacterium]
MNKGKLNSQFKLLTLMFYDRLIAATAGYFDLPIITNNPVIRDSRFVEVLK